MGRRPPHQCRHNLGYCEVTTGWGIGPRTSPWAGPGGTQTPTAYARGCRRAQPASRARCHHEQRRSERVLWSCGWQTDSTVGTHNVGAGTVPDLVARGGSNSMPGNGVDPSPAGCSPTECQRLPLVQARGKTLEPPLVPAVGRSRRPGIADPINRPTDTAALGGSMTTDAVPGPDRSDGAEHRTSGMSAWAREKVATMVCRHRPGRETPGR